ncbi:MAG: argininosuccinate lyase [Deltaproteobacteria bacterium]|nr:argininosuccinate lyase [Deltaproteobacteria bacterium]
MKKNSNKKLWGGRFKKATPKIVDQFNASVGFDQALAPYDIQGSLAHAKMLQKQGVLSASEAKKIQQGLEFLLKKIQTGAFEWQLAQEDVHLNIESALTQKIGPTGGKLHTARSRNDQVATDLRLYCRDKVQGLLKKLQDFQRALLQLAQKNLDTLLPGYTHLQRAQPIRLAHYLLAYIEMAKRDQERLQDSLKRINTSPLGAGALAGSPHPIDRKFTAQVLSFERIAQNSLDAVSDRDFVVETLANLSLIMVHLSRLAEEWILWSSQEFQFIKLPQEFCTGSSMMPQKQNPDVLELIRGKTGRVFGSLQGILEVLKGLPLTYNKDMQEDKEGLFDALNTVETSLSILNLMLPKTEFNQNKMQAALKEGFVLATDLADYLSSRGIPFRECHEIVGQLVAHCQKKGIALEDLSLEELKNFHPKFEKSVFDWLNLEKAVERRQSLGGPAKQEVLRQIKETKKRLQA